MACGKTTLARAVAAASKLKYVDLDELIEEAKGCSVSEIFANEGEAEFRRLESEMLERVAAMGDVIVATGGGTPLKTDNMATMNTRGITVYLEVSRHRLMPRLYEGRRQRPLLAGFDDDELEAFADRSLAERRRCYEKSKVTFSGDLLDDADEIALTVSRFIESFNIPVNDEQSV